MNKKGPFYDNDSNFITISSGLFDQHGFEIDEDSEELVIFPRPRKTPLIAEFFPYGEKELRRIHFELIDKLEKNARNIEETIVDFFLSQSIDWISKPIEKTSLLRCIELIGLIICDEEKIDIIFSFNTATESCLSISVGYKFENNFCLLLPYTDLKKYLPNGGPLD